MTCHCAYRSLTFCAARLCWVKSQVIPTSESASETQRLRDCECFVKKLWTTINQVHRKEDISWSIFLRVDDAKSEVRLWVFGSHVKGRQKRRWVMLQAAVVIVRRRRGWWQLLLIIPLLHVGSVSQHEGVSGTSAGAKGSQTAQVAGRPRQPHLGPLWRSDRAAVELGLCEPWRDLHLCHGIQVRHEGWVLYASWLKEST